MPKQLQRILILLCSLAIIFIIIRRILIPDSFGELGHFRANSMIENEAHQPKYVGSEICTECHEVEAGLVINGVHNKLKCETCHGPGYLHIESNESKDIILPSGRAFCGKCHALNAARSVTIIKQVDINEHNIDEPACINCHNPHDPWN